MCKVIIYWEPENVKEERGHKALAHTSWLKPGTGYAQLVNSNVESPTNPEGIVLFKQNILQPYIIMTEILITF